MKKLVPAFFLVFIVASIYSSTISYAGEEQGALIVNTQWLAEHLKDPNLVVLHVASIKRDYTSGHIPGARYFWVGSFAQATPEMSYELMPVAHLKDALEAAGVSKDSRIILCGNGGNVSPVARVYLTLEYLGMGERTSVLDGGFAAWKSEGKETSVEVPKVARTTFTPDLHKDVFVDADWVNAHLHKPPVTIVDARAPEFYNGENAGQPRSGHIPGAKNLYFATLVDSLNKMLPVPKLKELFEKAGVREGEEVAAYCHVGQTASMVYFTARYLGYKAHLYDGSFDDWGGRMDLPVELPAKTDTTKK